MNRVVSEFGVDFTSFRSIYPSAVFSQKFSKSLDSQELMDVRLHGDKELAEFARDHFFCESSAHILLSIPLKAVYLIVAWNQLSVTFCDEYKVDVSMLDTLLSEDQKLELRFKIGAARAFVEEFSFRHENYSGVIAGRCRSICARRKLGDRTNLGIEIGDFLSYSLFSLVHYLSMNGRDVRIAWPEVHIQEDGVLNESACSYRIEAKRIAL